jgi:hypothetical protein
MTVSRSLLSLSISIIPYAEGKREDAQVNRLSVQEPRVSNGRHTKAAEAWIRPAQLRAQAGEGGERSQPAGLEA